MSQTIKLTTTNNNLCINNSEVVLKNTLDIISNNLSNELFRGTDLKNTLINSMSSEIHRVSNVENLLSSNIENKKLSSTSIESFISTTCLNKSTNANNVEIQLSSNISNEISRAISVENSISSYLDLFVSGASSNLNTVFEISKALLDNDQTVNTVVNTIGSEVFRANSEEVRLSELFNIHMANTITSNNLVTNSISNEISRSQSVAVQLSSNISVETIRATTSEAFLSTTITNNISNSRSLETVLSRNISNESIRAITSEASISNVISRETFLLRNIEGQQVINSNPAVIGTVLSSYIKLDYPNNNISTSSLGYSVTYTFDVQPPVNTNLFNPYTVRSVPISNGVWIISCNVGFYNLSGVQTHERLIVISETSGNGSTARYSTLSRTAPLIQFSPYIPIAPGLRYSDREYDDTAYSLTFEEKQSRSVCGCVCWTKGDANIYVNVGQSQEAYNGNFKFVGRITLTRVA
jgi:hypothetical protein